MTSAIGIRIGDEFLELGDASITLELVNPLFSEEIGNNSHSFRFSIDLTPHNRRLLEYPDAMMSSRDQDISAWLYLFGNPFQDATISVSESNKDQASISLSLGVSRLMRAIDSKHINEYDYGGKRQISNTAHDSDLNASSDMILHANLVATGTVDDYDYTFAPVRVIGMYSSEPSPSEDRNHVQNASEVPDFVNYYLSGSFTDEVRARNQGTNGYFPLIPFPYLIYVLKTIASSEGYELEETDTFLSHPQLRTLVFWNNQTLDKSYQVQSPVSGVGIRPTNLHTESIDVSRHLPTSEVKTLLRGLMQAFAVSPILNGNRLRLFWKGDVLTSDFIDWTQKVIEYQIGSSSSGYTFSDGQAQEDGVNLISEGNEPDEFILDQFTREITIEQVIPGSTPPTNEIIHQGYRPTQVVVGDGSESKSAEIYALQEEANTGSQPPGGGTFAHLRAEERINTVMYGLEPIPQVEDIRLMWYRGIIDFFGGFQGPFVQTATGSLGADPSQLPNDPLSLLWGGFNGLYQYWWEGWIDFITNAKAATYSLHLLPSDLFRLDWTKRYLVSVREGHSWGLPKKITLTIGRNGIQSATAEMMIKT